MCDYEGGYVCLWGLWGGYVCLWGVCVCGYVYVCTLADQAEFAVDVCWTLKRFCFVSIRVSEALINAIIAGVSECVPREGCTVD